MVECRSAGWLSAKVEKPLISVDRLQPHWLGRRDEAHGFLTVEIPMNTDNGLKAAKDAGVQKVPDDAVRQRAISYIQKQFGRLGDLPKALVPVIWVTVYQAMKVAMKAEAEGGPKGILKNALVGDRRLLASLEMATLRVQMLRKIIPIIRSHESQGEKRATARLLIDIFKWNIKDAPDMSIWRRVVVRQFAKSDAEYDGPIPSEIM